MISDHYHYVAIEIVNSRIMVACCAYNHKKMDQGRYKKVDFQMFIKDKLLRLTRQA